MKNSDSEIAELKAQLQEQDARIQQLIETPIVVSPASPKIDLDIIYSQINDIGELATIEYLFTDAAEFRDSKQIKGSLLHASRCLYYSCMPQRKAKA